MSLARKVFDGLNKNAKGLKKKIAIGTASLAMMTGLADNSFADINIWTSVPAEVVADGQTEYRMDVYADTTEPDIANTQIESAEWDVIVPEGIDITGAELPDTNNPSQNPNDFYYNFFMFAPYNAVDSTMDSKRKLTFNVRMVDKNEGPTSKTGILGSYYFTVNEGETGTKNFELDRVCFGDTNFPEPNSFHYYKDYPAIWGVQAHNEEFTIKRPALEGDANGDCVVNILDLIKIRNLLGADVESGDNSKADVNKDGRINILDMVYVRNRLGNRCE